MGDIISAILSLFIDKPIMVLVVIGYIVISFLKSAKEESNEADQDSYGGATWEEMERHYGITIEQKDGTADHSYDADAYIEQAKSVDSHEPVTIVGPIPDELKEPVRSRSVSMEETTDINRSNHSEQQVNRKAYDGDTATEVVIPKKKKKKKKEEPTLQERLAAYNRERNILSIQIAHYLCVMV